MTTVCAVDGVEVTTTRTNRLIHLDELPAGTEEHEIFGVDRDAWLEGVVKRADERALVVALMMHHRTVHPDPACAWLAQLEAAMKSPVG